MPGEKIEKNSIQVLKVFKMDSGIPQNNSHQELVRVDESEVNSVSEKTIKNVTLKEWIVVFILCFVNLINYMDRFTLAGILKDIQDFFGIADDKGGLLQTAFVLSYMIFAPIFGYLGDRYSRRKIMACGVLLWSLTTLLGSFMNDFGWFITFRALVGIGEASYSTIAPTIISDLFVKDLRSKMLALFYFAIPVGSGLGYIVGSETAKLAGSWQWGLRVTPGLGLIAVFLIFFVLNDPQRGQSEGSGHLETTSWREDIKHLLRNFSFMFSTAGFTCVAFVAGALAWWGPKFIYMGVKLQPNQTNASVNSVSYVFGIVSMMAGVLGVPTGSLVAQKLRPTHPTIDPHICAFGLLISSPLVFLACVTATYSTFVCYFFVFFAEFFLNLTWSIVADILLYVVLPTRRSMAEGFQLLISHALGDAGSPYLIGVLSETLKIVLHTGTGLMVVQEWNSESIKDNSLLIEDEDPVIKFKALQYALFMTCFVEILGGVFFLITAMYICEDKLKVEKAIQENSRDRLTNMENETSSLVS